MGILAKRLLQMHKSVYFTPRRANLIEADVIRKADIGEISLPQGRLDRITLRAESCGCNARKYMDHFSLVDDQGKTLTSYILKIAHSASEPRAAEVASIQGVGPRVLDCKREHDSDTVILEEAITSEGLFRDRKISSDEAEDYGKYLGQFFMALACPEEKALLVHQDFRPEHIYMYGRGKDIRIKLIDWGRGGAYGLKSVAYWAQELMWSFDHLLSFGDPVIWRSFIASLNEKSKANKEMEALNLPQHLIEAHENLISQRTHALTNRSNSYRFLSVKFLNMISKAMPLAISIGIWERFFADNRGKTGENLAKACEAFCRDNNISHFTRYDP